jgi:dTDP-4-dehydrorhamnose 3,5-epimerase
MQFIECGVSGARVIEPSRHVDERGYFARAWCREEFGQAGIEFAPVQANSALSLRKGTIRGLHYQVAPALEAKLVRCVRGAVFDVAVDLRPDSPTYLAWYGTYLSAENGRMLYVPQGCAHGCQSVEDDSEIYYMASTAFAAAHARGARFDDPAFRIQWPMPALVLSQQDRNWAPYTAPSGKELA